MATHHFIATADIPGWLTKLAIDNVVYVPKKEGQTIVYRPYTPGDTVDLSKKPTESAKHVLFPRSEALFRFQRQQASGQGGVALTAPEEPVATVLFGALSCDARGFLAFDPVFDGSGTEGQAKDVYYLKRREKTAIIAKACNTVLSSCFCTWVGGAPDSRQGADVLATELTGGLLLEIVTDKGAALVADIDVASSDQVDAAGKLHAAANASLGIPPDLSNAKDALLSCFDDTAFWEKETGGCLSCGACTYLCPTCYCFNITDQSNGIVGIRLRSWDSCMTSMFTLEASGHNPRTNRNARLKNRVNHKFSYYPNLHDGRFSCAGCGRCVRSCPSSVDIRRIVRDAITHVRTEKETANG